jgi:hypothetical protein
MAAVRLWRLPARAKRVAKAKAIEAATVREAAKAVKELSLLKRRMEVEAAEEAAFSRGLETGLGLRWRAPSDGDSPA